jgi:NAD(P)-dependent dehydrogenase (short-subunit alcohol dehydrogenase family)
MNDLHIKTVLITGATEGLGRATAMALAKQHTRLFLHGRNQAKLADVLAAAISAGAAPGTRTFIADFNELGLVRRLANEVTAATEQLDVLVNNAAAMFSTRRVTSDGFEANFGINFLAPTLLTLMLLPRLLACPGSRIVNLSSVGYKQAKPNFEDLQAETGYSMQGAYFTSKLFNLYTTLALAERLPTGTTTVNAAHPGGVRTQLARDFKGPMKWIFAAMMPLLFISPEKGAATSVYLATDPEVDGVTGQYFVKCKSEALTEIGKDRARREQLWKLLMQILKERADFVTPESLR